MTGSLRHSLFIVLGILSISIGQTKTYPHRWVFVSRSLRADKDVTDIEQIVRIGAAHGLNGMVLSAGLDRLDKQPAEYFDRLAKIKDLCERKGIEIVPNIFSVGYGGSVLAYDRNLAAGIPVENAPFLVEGNRARIAPLVVARIANAGFERHDGNRLADYRFHDRPGEISFVDTETFHGGKASLRFENFGRDEHGHARVMQEVKVQPHRCYRLSCWVKTDRLDPGGAFRIQVLTEKGRSLAPFDPRVPSTSDWRKIEMGFNSLDYEMVRIYAGVWGGKAGRFWIDDFELEEVGLLNVLRRPGTPVTVRNAKTGRGLRRR